ncbi:MAG: hypothetical protein ABW252_19610 [Polyangiales bacterium]
MNARAPAPLAALRGSWTLFRRRPLGALAVAIAQTTSLLAVCCGLGVVATPWFVCELTALQIGCGLGETAARKRSWLSAGLIYVVVALVIASIAALTMLAVGGDVTFGAAHVALPLSRDLFLSVAILLGASAFALLLVAPFAYAAPILIDRGGSLSAALLESARLSHASGLGRSWLTLVLGYALQLLPAVATVVLAMSRGTLAGTVWWCIGMLPVNALGVALGQGMVVASYLALRPGLAPVAQLRMRMPRPRGMAWLPLLVLVMVGPWTALGALTKPARLGEGALPEGAPVLLDLSVKPEPREMYLPDTALRLAVDDRKVRVIASDGGGAGRLPLPPGPVAQVRAARAVVSRTHQGSFAIEVRLASGARYLTTIDEAGVRLDDTLARRFAQRLPGLRGLTLLACLLWAGVWLCRALPTQAVAQKRWRETRTQIAAKVYQHHARRGLVWLMPAVMGSIGVAIWVAARG